MDFDVDNVQSREAVVNDGGLSSPQVPAHRLDDVWTAIEASRIQCCFMATEIVRTIRDREHRTAT